MKISEGRLNFDLLVLSLLKCFEHILFILFHFLRNHCHFYCFLSVFHDFLLVNLCSGSLLCCFKSPSRPRFFFLHLFYILLLFLNQSYFRLEYRVANFISFGDNILTVLYIVQVLLLFGLEY